VTPEFHGLDDVGHGYDLVSAEERRLAVTLGRHCGDWVTSFYTWMPSAFMIAQVAIGVASNPDLPAAA
jgi:hypothetical protein